MSNHWHGVVTDPEARLPEFLEIFHKLIAKSQNASLGRWENFWASGKTSVVWPGVISNRFGEEREIEMPDRFFDPDGPLPQVVILRFVRPQIFPELTDSQLQAQLNTEVAKLVRRARQDMALRGLPFVGSQTILRQRFDATPKTPAPRRNPNPQIAAKSTPLRVQAIERMLEFVRAYRAAWNDWRNGNPAALFPAGTYALRIYARVACAPAVPA